MPSGDQGLAAIGESAPTLRGVMEPTAFIDMLRLLLVGVCAPLLEPDMLEGLRESKRIGRTGVLASLGLLGVLLIELLRHNTLRWGGGLKGAPGHTLRRHDVVPASVGVLTEARPS